MEGVSHCRLFSAVIVASSWREKEKQ